ncbi:MAG: hypothetical protein RLZ48_257, partial [Actinomycetota bacterium]
REVGSLTGLPPISGHVEPAFSAVLDAFRNNFAEHNEIGGAVCVSVRGKVVVDLVGGWRDVARTLTWEHDTLVNAFSVGKGLTALVAAILVDMGELSYDTVVPRVWPDFTGAGKESLTFADLLGHRAGLPAVRRTLPPRSMYDWDFMCTELAATEPWWQPGTAHGYHVNTFGFLCGEVMRRVTGQTVGQLFRSLLHGPLGADVHLGVPAAEHHRIAEFEWPPTALTEVDTTGFTEQQLLQYNTYNNPLGTSGGGTVNTSEWRCAEIPSTNTHASARGIERVYRELAAGGGQIISESALASALTETSNGPDVVLERNARFARGFQIPLPERGFGPNPTAFGHFGAGGSVGFCDPSTGVAFGYVMNQMGPRWQNPRNRALMDAVFASL